jgi:predicted Zn finger-like uncharacterized protein
MGDPTGPALMDVRCEKCQTEYELDEAKVSEAGVTVKCTTCGNLFKIRRRGQSVMAPTPLPPQTVPEGSTDRLWLIRNPRGEIQRFRELTTLQQWIVEQKVTRDCEISRTGETWKRLGDIAELASFFIIVEQAQASARAAAEKTTAQRTTTLPMGTGAVVQPAKNPTPAPQLRTQTPAAALRPPPASGPIVRPAVHGDAPPPSRRPRTPTPPPAVTTAPAAFGEPTRRIPAVNDGPVQRPPVAPPSAPTMVPKAESPSQSMSAVEPTGPVGGLRPTPGGAPEPAWAAGGDGAARKQFLAELDDDLNVYRPPKRRIGWIALFVILVGAAGFGVWYFAIRSEKKTGPIAEPTASPSPTASASPTASPAAVAQPTASPTVVKPPEPVVAPTPAEPAETPSQKAYRAAIGRFWDDTDESFLEADKMLEQAAGADAAEQARSLGARALIRAAWAQYLLDDAALLEAAKDRKKASSAKSDAQKHLARADKLAREAVAKDEKVVEGQIALADVKRLSKRKPADVERHLAGIDTPEATYVRGLLAWREGKAGDARNALEAAAKAHLAATGREHLRARYHLAAIALADKRWEDARTQLEMILGAQPEHARAKALLADVERKQALAKPETPSEPTNGGGGASGEPAGNDYDGLVAKGDKLAENGSCSQAQTYYEKALDLRPGGVEALTGLGYCYLDAKDYGRAQRNFRAALGISPRFGDALIGIAEAYRFQGNKDEALKYYQKYVEAHPSGPKASIAKRHIADLGGASETPKEEPKPEPSPTETPKETPDPRPDPVDTPPEPPKEDPKPEPSPAASPEKVETPPGGTSP